MSEDEWLRKNNKYQDAHHPAGNFVAGAAIGAASSVDTGGFVVLCFVIFLLKMILG